MSHLETAPVPRAGRDSPYLGLGFYSEENAGWFFGRDRERQRIIGNLRASRLTVLYAESGVGKSSLLRAGVAARLRELAHARAAERGSPGYIPLVFSVWRDEPTGQLIGEIEQAIKPFLPQGSSVELPREGTLEQAIEAASAATDATLLIILDQFEEYFLYSSRESREGRFADELSRCVGREDLRANFLIALREDAYAGLGDHFKGRIANVYRNYLHLERLDRRSAREAIERPIEFFNSVHRGVEPMSIDSDLVDAVLDQVRAGEVGRNQVGIGGVSGRDGAARGAHGYETPYLQLVMSRLWQRERESGSHVLRRATLEELGGAEEIVKRHLDEALSGLTSQERETAIDVFHYLVTPSGTKIAYEIKDLPEYSGHSVAEVNALIERLESGEQRVLRQVAAPPGSTDGPRVEIFHDVLADAILDWRNRQIPARLEREKRAAEESARRDRRRSRILMALLALVVVVSVAAFFLWRSAAAERDTAQSRQLAAAAVANLTRDPELSTLLALSALRKSHTSQAEAALRAALPLLQLRRTLLAGASVSDAAYSRDGHLIATVESGGVARIWEAGSRHQVAVLGRPGEALDGVAFSPDGNLLATAGEDGTALLWNVSTHAVVGAPIREPGGRPLLSVAFSPDGKRLLTASEDGTARIWDVVHSRHEQLGVISAGGKENSINDAQFNPDGTQIVTAEAHGAAQVWQARGAAPRVLYAVHEPNEPNSLLSASFSPSGRSILTTSLGGDARIWNAVATPQPPPSPLQLPLPQEQWFGATVSAAFSPNSKLVVTAGNGGAFIFEAGSRKRTGTLAQPGTHALNATVFAPDGEHVLTAGADGSTRIWSPPAHPGTSQWSEVGASLQGNGTGALGPVAFSADGKLIAAAGQDGTASVWEVVSGRRVAVVANPGRGTLTALAFDPADPRMLLTASSDGSGAEGSVALWDTTTGGGHWIESVSPSPDAVAFSPHGDRFAVASGYEVAVVDTREDQVLETLAEPSHERINELAFDPRGNELATAGSHGFSVWGVGGASKPLRTVSTTAPIEAARFSPNGKFIVTAGDDGTAREWNLADVKPRGEGMTEPGHAIVRDAEFGADGSRILTASTDGVARIWNASTQRLLTSLAGHTGRIITASFSPVPGANLVATSSSDGSVKLWFALPREQLGATLSMGPSFPSGASFSPNGSMLITAGSDGVARIWEARSHRQVGSVGRHGEAGLDGAAFSADGKLIITAGDDGRARIWSTERRSELAALQAGGGLTLNSAAFSPRDDNVVVTASQYGTAEVWRGETKVGVIRERGEAPITSAHFSPDGEQILTTSGDGVARILTSWTLAGNPRQLAVLSEPGGDDLNRGEFSPDGKLVVTASNDGSARIWNAGTGVQEAVLNEPGGAALNAAEFSPDGSEILTASVDGTARIWEWKSGRLLTEFPVGDGVLEASFASSGEQVVTASRAGAQVWSSELAAPLGALEGIAGQRVTRPLTAAERATYGLG